MGASLLVYCVVSGFRVYFCCFGGLLLVFVEGWLAFTGIVFTAGLLCFCWVWVGADWLVGLIVWLVVTGCGCELEVVYVDLVWFYWLCRLGVVWVRLVVTVCGVGLIVLLSFVC